MKLNVDMCLWHSRTFAEVYPGFHEGCRKTVPRTATDWLVLVTAVFPTCTSTIHKKEDWKGKRLCWETGEEVDVQCGGCSGVG